MTGRPGRRVGGRARPSVAARLGSSLWPLPVVGIVLAAVYILWMYQRTMNGPTAEKVTAMPDLSGRERLAIIPILAIIVALGFYPKPVLDVINPATTTILDNVGVHDPGPTVVGEEASH